MKKPKTKLIAPIWGTPFHEIGFGLVLNIDPYFTQSSSQKSEFVTGEGSFIVPYFFGKNYLNEYFDVNVEFSVFYTAFSLLYRPYKSKGIIPEIVSLSKLGVHYGTFFGFTLHPGVMLEEKLALTFKPAKWLSFNLGMSVRYWTGTDILPRGGEPKSKQIYSWGSGTYLVYGPLLNFLSARI